MSVMSVVSAISVIVYKLAYNSADTVSWCAGRRLLLGFSDVFLQTAFRHVGRACLAVTDSLAVASRCDYVRMQRTPKAA
jgi:hypothetical protein